MEHILELLGHLAKEFAWLLWGLLILGLVWFFMGGPARDSAHEGPYIKPLEPVSTGQVYGNYYAGAPTAVREKLNLPEWPATLVLDAESLILDIFSRPADTGAIHQAAIAADGLYIDGVAGARIADPDTEYVRIVASPQASGPLELSGLSLGGDSSSRGIIIPTAVSLPRDGVALQSQSVYLRPGGRAIITTGASPIGYSFETNECTGYLNARGTFVPELTNDCPGNRTCKTDAAKGFAYGACVTAHENDPNFYTGNWRIFLGQTSEMWSNLRDTIRLMDANGKAIDALSY